MHETSASSSPGRRLMIRAGAVTLAYGTFINTIVNFIIVAFALFLVVKAMNTVMKKAEAPAAPPAPTKEETLLTEIRDILARR